MINNTLLYKAFGYPKITNDAPKCSFQKEPKQDSLFYLLFLEREAKNLTSLSRPSDIFTRLRLDLSVIQKL